jgi:hypothetical protein
MHPEAMIMSTGQINKKGRHQDRAKVKTKSKKHQLIRPVLRLHLAIDMELLSVGFLLLHQLLVSWEIHGPDVSLLIHTTILVRCLLIVL